MKKEIKIQNNKRCKKVLETRGLKLSHANKRKRKLRDAIRERERERVFLCTRISILKPQNSETIYRLNGLLL